MMIVLLADYGSIYHIVIFPKRLLSNKGHQKITPKSVLFFSQIQWSVCFCRLRGLHVRWLKHVLLLHNLILVIFFFSFGDNHEPSPFRISSILPRRFDAFLKNCIAAIFPQLRCTLDVSEYAPETFHGVKFCKMLGVVVPIVELPSAVPPNPTVGEWVSEFFLGLHWRRWH